MFCFVVATGTYEPIGCQLNLMQFQRVGKLRTLYEGVVNEIGSTLMQGMNHISYVHIKHAELTSNSWKYFDLCSACLKVKLFGKCHEEMSLADVYLDLV